MNTLANAKKLLTRTGWLSQQPAAFRAEIWRRAAIAHFLKGDVIYRAGDPPGGVFGIISGAVAVTVSPGLEAPQLFHVCLPGDWFGEGCFLLGEPRRVGTTVAVETWAVHLPLGEMHQMAREYPPSVKCFTKMLTGNLDTLLRAFHDLHNPNEHGRVASALERITSERNNTVPLSQGDVGAICNASRKQVNEALRRFESAGCLKRGYRSIVIIDRTRLRRFAKATTSNDC